MDVVFPVMPFADAGRPSMGVSLLSAEARRAGYATRVRYFNLRLAERMGLQLYQTIASSFPPNMLVGEWYFADDLFGDAIPSDAEYLEDILSKVAGTAELAPRILAIRKERDAYLAACVDAIMADRPKIVGFSSTFHQTCACLAVARRLKKRQDAPVIVFGGANCEGEMGLQLIRSFPWIDFICCGESDVSFPRLLDRLLRGREDTPIPGVLEQGSAAAVVRSDAVTDMDSLPYPEFDGYFDDLAGTTLAGTFETHLVFETSRGCWWGAKHHCTFCGLNGDTMVFRSKAPDRAFEEIGFLTQKYGSKKLGCVDNILDMHYIDALFPRLADAGYELELFYEVKANLRYPQLKKMRAAGITQIQPGIESFSDQVLRLMEKGCTGLQNIQLLRWSEELGIAVSWNILAGFPNEDSREYDITAGLIPLLTHLAPPCSCGVVRLDRFSPFHTRADQYGFKRMRPARAYYYVFPFDTRELNRLAYYFDFDYEDGRQPQAYLYPVQQQVQGWVAARSADGRTKPRLDVRFEEGRAIVEDTRLCAVAPRHDLAGLPAEVLMRCDTIVTARMICAELGAPAETVEKVLADLLERRLIVESGGRYLTLVVFRNRPADSSFQHVPEASARVPEAAHS